MEKRPHRHPNKTTAQSTKVHRETHPHSRKYKYVHAPADDVFDEGHVARHGPHHRQHISANVGRKKTSKGKKKGRVGVGCHVHKRALLNTLVMFVFPACEVQRLSRAFLPLPRSSSLPLPVSLCLSLSLSHPKRLRKPNTSIDRPMIGCPVKTKKKPTAKMIDPLNLEACQNTKRRREDQRRKRHRRVETN